VRLKGGIKDMFLLLTEERKMNRNLTSIYKGVPGRDPVMRLRAGTGLRTEKGLRSEKGLRTGKGLRLDESQAGRESRGQNHEGRNDGYSWWQLYSKYDDDEGKSSS